jgi:hypothetical protein
MPTRQQPHILVTLDSRHNLAHLVDLASTTHHVLPVRIQSNIEVEMLHALDDQGNLAWYCRNPDCRYHSCQAWDDGIKCLAHPDRQNGTIEEAHTAHISDPDIRWVGPQEIALPVCPDCGDSTTLHIHSDEELTPPIITRDEITGKILQVAPHPHPKYSPNLWQTHIDITRKRVPHETLAHLSPDQIAELQAYNRNLAPNIPVDWMMTEAIYADIQSVTQHPAVTRHRALAEQMTSTGKMYEPPTEVITPTIEETITKLLQEHGLLTSPRVPIVKPSESS